MTSAVPPSPKSVHKVTCVSILESFTPLLLLRDTMNYTPNSVKHANCHVRIRLSTVRHTRLRPIYFFKLIVQKKFKHSTENGTVSIILWVRLLQLPTTILTALQKFYLEFHSDKMRLDRSLRNTMNL